jgi:hypothetical protein
VGVFVGGDSVQTLDGAVVIKVTDKAKAAAAFPKLIGLGRQQGDIPFVPTSVPGATQAFKAEVPPGGPPGPVVAALGDERAVIALSAEAARAALDPSDTIEDSGLYERAKDAVDDIDPSLVIDGPGLVKLITNVAGSEPDFAKAKPYLDLIDVIAAGSEKDGDRIRGRYAVTLR